MHKLSHTATVLGFIGAFVLFVTTGLAYAEGDPAEGRKKFNTCAGCHAIPGYHTAYPSYRVPRVAGQYPGYIDSALQAYAAGQRPHSSMYANASTLTAQDRLDIAAYLAGLPADTGTAKVFGDPVIGKEKAATCDSCHGAGAGEGQSPRPPKLAGQHQDFLVHVLEEYRSGTRINAIMNGMAAALSDEDIRNISAYYAGQEPDVGTVDY